jgi:archaellum component FlaG (FlaF/FlaG flagellin family)
MNKSVLVCASIALFLASCNVRTKDKVDNNIAAESKNEISSALSTSVEIIDSVYDFGKVKEGEIVEFNYRFKNIGSNPLVVSNASASCGCTVPEKPEAPIKTGDTGFIKVKFNSEGRPGTAHKTITILSNANPSFPELLLKGEVTPSEKQ